ncbi:MULTISPECIES: PDDEXK-like family protein [unclassified Rhizobium]|uniref:PDDEXK-like family protein n=1 Tax=unclassified Rhizobium TaxID=2613769 RepID=UPI001ADB03F6|nr:MULTISPECIES: PD-(D/E)XK nuclease family protein [unclassified Rhizobium]MBO9127946.1 PD-(D/E)XK nuclease family protein [Rhizobium sp. 16-488-2b]MBO9178523.1 PD-(D/E)XK nuclease family protein [Rhizobium sp. 16-488-2a]
MLELLQAVSEVRRPRVAALALAAEPQIDVEAYRGFLAALRSALATVSHDGQLLNVWKIAGLKRNEVRTSSVLGWILDPRGSHGFGPAVLHALVDRARSKPGAAEAIHRVDLGRRYHVAVEHSAFEERDNRVDLAITGSNCVIFIEVKIDAREGKDQLARYAALARRKATALHKPVAAVLYLSQASHPDVPDGIVAITWKDVAAAIIAATSGISERTLSAQLLRQFASHVETLH